jgi:hypothetical protein
MIRIIALLDDITLQQGDYAVFTGRTQPLLHKGIRRSPSLALRNLGGFRATGIWRSSILARWLAARLVSVAANAANRNKQDQQTTECKIFPIAEH